MIERKWCVRCLEDFTESDDSDMCLMCRAEYNRQHGSKCAA